MIHQILFHPYPNSLCFIRGLILGDFFRFIIHSWKKRKLIHMHGNPINDLFHGFFGIFCNFQGPKNIRRYTPEDAINPEQAISDHLSKNSFFCWKWLSVEQVTIFLGKKIFFEFFFFAFLDSESLNSKKKSKKRPKKRPDLPKSEFFLNFRNQRRIWNKIDIWHDYVS